MNSVADAQIALDDGRWFHLMIFRSESFLCEHLGAVDDAAFLGFAPGQWAQEYSGIVPEVIGTTDETQIHPILSDPNLCLGVFFFSVENRRASLIAHEALHALLWLQKLATGRKRLDFGKSDAATAAEEDAAFLLERITDQIITSLDCAASAFRRTKVQVAA